MLETNPFKEKIFNLDENWKKAMKTNSTRINSSVHPGVQL